MTGAVPSGPRAPSSPLAPPSAPARGGFARGVLASWLAVLAAGVALAGAGAYARLAGAFEADYQKSLRALFGILGGKGVSFGVLAKERCNGDVAKRTGNEYLFQELAGQNVEELNTAGVKKVVTSCPHCLKTLGHDYKEFGFEAEVVHSSVLVEALTRLPPSKAAGEVARALGLDRRALYARALELKG